MTKIERTALRVAAVGAVLLLAGCGGSGATAGAGAASSGCGCGSSTQVTAASDPVDYYNNVLVPGYNSYHDELYGDTYTGATAMANTTTMPTTGTATYTGYAAVAGNYDNAVTTQPNIVAVGTAELSADFGTGSLSGSATNFVGGPFGPPDPKTGNRTPTAKVQYYAGTVTVSNGCIGTANGCSNVTQPYQVSANYKGTLTGGGNTVAVSGQALGDFKGTSAQGVTLLTNTGTVTLNGAKVDGGLQIYAKQ